jgi:hypothetical protein
VHINENYEQNYCIDPSNPIAPNGYENFWSENQEEKIMKCKSSFALVNIELLNS